MKLSEIGELSLLDMVRRRFNKKAHGLILGIGDDSAVVKNRKANVLFTTDMMIEGVHFDLSWTTPYQLGCKLIAVNVSDIYAMGGKPDFVLLNIALPKDMQVYFLKQLFNGIDKAIKTYGITLIGGDMSSSEKLILSATLTGHASRIIRRNGARLGDRIYVTGYLGDSACGLELLKKKFNAKKEKLSLSKNIISRLIKRHLMPVPKYPGNLLRHATSMIDISDGLIIDLSRICRESKVGAKIYIEKVPISNELKKATGYLNLSPLEFAMAGGEDYELLFTAPESKSIKAYCIGEIIKTGIKAVDETGKVKNIAVKGYQHFTS